MAPRFSPEQEIFANFLRVGATVTEALDLSGHWLTACDDLDGFYVYVLIDPRDDKVFYVGKGKGKRHFSHVREWFAGEIVNAPKFDRIGDILCSGNVVVSKCFAADLGEGEALDLERWLIHRIGWDNLTNLSRGEQSEKSKAIANLRDVVRRIRPFCRWKLFILPQLSNSGLSREQHEHLYWDIIGNLTWHLAELEGKQVRKFPMTYKAAA